MTKRISFKTIGQTLLGIFLGAVISIVPFYFETKAMTQANFVTNERQDGSIQVLEKNTNDLTLELAVEKSERLHNKQALERIEKKLDQLLREVKTSQ